MLYSRIPLYGHPLNTDTLLLRAVCFVPGGKKLHTYSLTTDTPLIWTLSIPGPP